MNFYERFIDLCGKAGVSPAAVASKIGLSNSSTTYWKRGSTPRGDTLQKLADYFGVTVEYLLGKEIGKNIATMQQIVASGSKLELSESGKSRLTEDQQREFHESTAKFNLLMDELNALPDDERQKMIDAVLTLIGSKKEPPQPE